LNSVKLDVVLDYTEDDHIQMSIFSRTISKINSFIFLLHDNFRVNTVTKKLNNVEDQVSFF